LGKSIVFISHITEEKELAIALKELIETSFLGMIEVFVSSDEHSISLGQKWLDNITAALKNCTIEIILCSSKSIKRPWINFEAGAGWIREITVIPLCHSGITPSNLPLPLNLLQATTVSEVSSLKLLFPILAQAIGAKTPQIDFSKFIKKVTEFEDKYMFWDDCNSCLGKLNQFNPLLIEGIKKNVPLNIELTEIDIKHLESIMDFFQKNKIMQLMKVGGLSVSSKGVYYNCQLVPLSNLIAIFSNNKCKFK